MATAHIRAEKGDFAETILLPGDPLRAKYIAENFLSDVVQVNDVRGMLGYTGNYQGKRVSVMGSGMGMPSIGIYAHELITQFGVKNLIRIGSCGSYQADVHVRDIIIGQATSTNSNWQSQYNLPGTFAPVADWGLLRAAVEQADNLGVRYHVGNILSSDIFYNAQPDAWKKWAAMGVLGVEMEAAALYMTAAHLGAKALCILTVSDSLVTWEETTAEEREKTFTDMMKIALEIA
ncbi:MAG: purine-nucleoside phosphorylase [Culicoidibacterales bacterium]